MADIQVLAPHVADLIAAGEVVERPASVVKELCENAIDAGATNLTVEIQRGGMALIRVTDNGCGIPEAQCQRAFLRHATSKLRTSQDLEAIGTLGFRGEALAAIAAVARVELFTCPPGATLGTNLVLEGGQVLSQEQAGCPPGTTLVVRDLFFNTPARLKFMKRDAAEGAAVYALVQRLALSHPEVAVKFLREGKQELVTPGDGQTRSALYAVLGRDLALGFLPVKGEGEGVTVEGFVSLPACCRGSRNYQHFFVNGRQVKSKLLMAALERAYENQKMVGKFPGCVLHLTVKANEVDVNVHPAKTEVKFLFENKVFQGLYYAVLSALSSDTPHPTASFSPPKGDRPSRAVPPRKAPQTLTPTPAPLLREPTAALLRPEAKADPPLSPPAPMPVRERAQRTEAAPKAPSAPNPVAQPRPEPPKAPPAPPPAVEAAAPIQEHLPVPPPEPVAAPVPVAAPLPEAPPVDSAPEAPSAPETAPWRLAGEVLQTYLIVEQGDEVLFIDKHAAHERLNFDRMKAQGYTPMAQALLEPLVLTPPPQEAAVLLEQRELLASFGFACDAFGGDSLVIREIPDYLHPGQVEDTLGELAEQLLSGAGADPAAARDVLLHTMACKAAIKGGQRNSPEELRVVAQAVVSGQVKYCPHGRPVAIRLSKGELERQFKRA